jgi:uncharacterized small protein (DUF1192 family)
MTLYERIAELRSDLAALEAEIARCHANRWRPRAVRLMLIASSRRAELRALTGTVRAEQ